MLKIETFPLGPLGTNCYLLVNPEANRALIIDPGMQPAALIERIAELEIEAILLTHAHFDHIGGVDQIRKLKECPVYLHKNEADWLVDPQLNSSAKWPDLGPPITSAPAEFTLDEGQVLALLGVSIKVFHTPGHSPGSVSFLYGDHLFSGDVLFRESVGRTDLADGSSVDLHLSIHSKLFVLDDHVQVYPGHGPKTSIGHEKVNNPYV